MTVQLGLCRNWSEPKLLFFSRTGSCVLIIQDRRGTIKKIADFLGRTLTETDIDNVMEHTSLENMKNNPACNYQYVEQDQKVDKTNGAFINAGNHDHGILGKFPCCPLLKTTNFIYRCT